MKQEMVQKKYWSIATESGLLKENLNWLWATKLEQARC